MDVCRISKPGLLLVCGLSMVGCGAPLASGPQSAAQPSPASAAGEASIEIVKLDDGSPPIVEVRGLDDKEVAAFDKLDADARGKVFRIVVGGVPDAPNVAGEYETADGKVRFTPRYPLEPGLAYQLAFDRGPLGSKTSVLNLALDMPARVEAPRRASRTSTRRATPCRKTS